ncbi:PucR family transcriptional regulator [Kineosporiaceae bacterium B12]|nr:PucR family transcriptional regulator [Kineococcus rubinsiae]
MRTRGGPSAGADLRGGRTLLVHPVGAAGRPQEFLVLSVPADLPRAARSTTAAAVALLGLVADRERAERQRDRRLLGCAVDLLCTGDTAAARQVLHADGTGAVVPDRLRVLRADGDGVDDALDALGAVPGALAARTDRPGGALVVVCADAPAPLRRVEEALLRHGCRVGTGSPVPAEEAADSDASARAALRRTSGGDPHVRADDAHRAGLAAALGPDGVRSYARDVLAPLDALDPAEAERLVRAGRAFLEHHGQRQPTADALGVHRNTVRQRVARLEQVLGRSMDSPADRADLWVALTAGPAPS